MWTTIDKFKRGDIVKLLHGDRSTSIAKILNDGLITFEIKIIDGTERGRTYTVFGSHEAILIHGR